MTVKSRREEYAEVTRTAIIDAAIALFATEGYLGANIDAIAVRARVTKGAVYHHFADKSALFEAAYIAVEDRLVSTVLEKVEGLDDPRHALLTGMDAFLEECCTPGFARIALEEAPVALGWKRWKQTEEKYFLGLIQMALQAMSSLGQISPVLEIPLTARMLLAALDEAGLAVALSQDTHAERRKAHAVLTTLVTGLAPLA